MTNFVQSLFVLGELGLRLKNEHTDEMNEIVSLPHFSSDICCTFANIKPTSHFVHWVHLNVVSQ